MALSAKSLVAGRVAPALQARPVLAPRPSAVCSATAKKEAAASSNVVGKQALVSSISSKLGVSQKDVAEVIDAVVEEIQAAVTADKRVTIMGFGTFEQRARAARSGRNPSTGEPMQIKASKAAAFKAGKAFKDRVNGVVAAPKKAAAPKAPAAPKAAKPAAAAAPKKK